MRTSIVAVTVMVGLLGGGIAAYPQGQYQNQQQLGVEHQYYTPPQSDNSQPPRRRVERYPARRAFVQVPSSHSYDPLAGHHEFQNSRGGFWSGVKRDINPCKTDYGVVLDGWHDMGLLMTVENTEWWLSWILLIALIVVGFDDIFRSLRAQEIREAMAGAALLFTNDRAYAVSKCNEAIDKYNALAASSDESAQDVEAVRRIEVQNAVRSAVIQAAESATNPDEESSAEAVASTPPTQIPAAPVPVEPPVATDDKGKVESADDGDDQANVEGQRVVTMNLGGKKYKVPQQIQLQLNGFNRKVESQRNQINRLEERLRQYEKD